MDAPRHVRRAIHGHNVATAISKHIVIGGKHSRFEEYSFWFQMIDLSNVFRHRVPVIAK
jgi:hypothetical protein